MVMALSVAFSGVGVLVIAMLDDTSHVLIPDWEDDLPQSDVVKEVQLRPAVGVVGDDD